MYTRNTKILYFFFKFVRHFMYNEKNKKIVLFYYLTGERIFNNI